MDAPRLFPVSGGSEAVETALKMARAYHLARGEDRHVVIGRQGAYHGNTLATLDVGGPSQPAGAVRAVAGPARHTTTPYEYRCAFADTHPDGCGARHAAELDALIEPLGPDQVAAFIAEPVAGAALGACVPPADYWPAIQDVCRKHGVLLIADEVMTGFGRTGDLVRQRALGAASRHHGVAKGAASGYWPLGIAIASGPVFDDDHGPASPTASPTPTTSSAPQPVVRC